MRFLPKSKQSAQSAEKARLAPAEPAQERQPSGTKGFFSGLRPALRIGGVPLLWSGAKNVRSARSSMPGGKPTPATTVSAKEMSAAAHGAAVDRITRGLDALHPVAHLEGLPAVPETWSAMRNQDALINSIDKMFGSGSPHRAECIDLAVALFEAVPPSEGTETPQLNRLALATALHTVGAKTPQNAEDLIQQARDGVRSPELFRLERLLAATVPGMKALAHLRGLPDDPAQTSRLREELNLCSDLERQNVRLVNCESVEQVLDDLARNRDTKIDVDIGGPNDSPMQLLGKATRYAHALRVTGGVDPRGAQSDPAAREALNALSTRDAYKDWDAASDRCAYVAWKQGGFVESGKGTDFNKAIGRMHKFLTYVERADHGPRTGGNLLRDAGSYFGRAVGVGKSPLSAARHGTLGGDKVLLQMEAAKVQRKLGEALTSAMENLVAELRDSGPATAGAKFHEKLARAALLDLWRETGDTDHTVQSVLARAEDLMAHVDAGMAPLDEGKLTRGALRCARKVRTESGDQTVRVGIRALEAVAAARGARSERQAGADTPDTESTPAQRREKLRELLTELHNVAEVGGDAKPLFKLSDLKALLHLGPPREGPTAEDARRVITEAIKNPLVTMCSMSDGAIRGVGSLGAFALNASAVLGTPVMYPVAGLEHAKSAKVAFGALSTGGRLFIGTENSGTGTLGVGGGWIAPPLAGQNATALVLANVAASHTRSQALGLAVSTRKDKPGWSESLPNFVDFLFDQAKMQDGEKATAPAELWRRYAERFGDDPHLAINWTEERTVATGASVGAAAVARARVGPTLSVGPAVSAGAGVGGSSLTRSVNADGGDVPTTLIGRQGVARMSMAGTQSLPFVPLELAMPVIESGIAGWVAGMPWASAGLEWRGPGGLGLASVGRNRDGTLNPAMCQRFILFNDVKAMAEYVNLRRDGFEQTIVDQDANRVASRGDARQRLNKYLQDASEAHSPLALHGEVAVLAPAVGQEVNALEARMKMILGYGDREAVSRELSAQERGECIALQNEVHRLLHDESSWVVRSLISAESHLRASTTGLNFGLRAADVENASALHLTAAMMTATAPSVGQVAVAPALAPTALAGAATVSEASQNPQGRTSSAPPSHNEPQPKSSERGVSGAGMTSTDWPFDEPA